MRLKRKKERKQTHLFSHNSGVEKSKIKELAGLVLSGDSEGDSPCLFPVFWWLPTVLSIPRLVVASLHSVPLSSQGFLPCVSPSISVSSHSLLFRSPVLGFMAYPNPGWPHLDYFTRVALTKYHKLRGLKNRNFFFHCSGSQRSKIKVPWGLVSCEMTTLACRRPPSYCTHTAIPLCSCSPGVSSSSSKDTSPFGLEPHLYDLI